MESWEEATALLGTTQEIVAWLARVLRALETDMKDDYDQQKPVSRTRLRQLESVISLSDAALGKVVVALDTIRLQRSALFRQGIMYEIMREEEDG